MAILVRKPGKNRPLWRPRYRWEDNVKIDLREIRCENTNWIHLDNDAVQRWLILKTALERSDSIKAGEFPYHLSNS